MSSRAISDQKNEGERKENTERKEDASMGKVSEYVNPFFFREFPFVFFVDSLSEAQMSLL